MRGASLCLQPRVYCPLQAPDSGLPAPDATIYLSMTAEAAAKRGGYGSERYEKVSPLQVGRCRPLRPDPMLVMPAPSLPCTQIETQIYLAALHDVLKMPLKCSGWRTDEMIFQSLPMQKQCPYSLGACTSSMKSDRSMSPTAGRHVT